MTLRLSTGLVNRLAQNNGFGRIFAGGSINIYAGSQPATADSAVTGTLLGTVTAASAALTQETRATGTIVITGGSTSITAVTVGTFNIIPDGPVPYNTSTAQTASDLCDAINRNGVFDATVSSSTVTITARSFTGTAYNGLTLTSTGSVTATYGGGTVSGGIAPVNGLIFAQPAVGVISKPSTQIWSFNGLAIGTAGWFRFIGSQADAGAALAAAPWLPRLDGSIAVSGGDLALSNIAVTVSSPNTIDTFTWQQPQS